jgi:hypothetical protein
VESLEDRTVPSTLTVTSAADDGSAGTLRAVLAAAAPGDTIQFSHQLNHHTITLALGQLVIGKNLKPGSPGGGQCRPCCSANSRCTQPGPLAPSPTIAVFSNGTRPGCLLWSGASLWVGRWSASCGRGE